MSIPAFFGDEDDDDDEDEDEDIDKVRVERMVSFLRQMLDVPLREIAHLRQDGRQSVELTIQCSDVADLSAMRALALEAVSNWKDGAPRNIDERDVLEELALDIDDMLEPIRTLESALKDLTLRTAKNIADPQTAICTDEVLRALSQLAQVETQTLTLYWKTRQLLNKSIM
ncbi:hypothetical protein BBO99_00000645 [Phytophthora kernoviae]|uniref:Uncharacterized protein n=2 Tax=Phytophthora kernoviae TaxID=325452 RepID=A0A3R7J968_9STRA|nr:hypothetical protein G195_001652 [Phytophthora kernoviae 00238/432]KAG2530736.1 hypothetical protein JM16_001477 [Phytophthora kernoviae]KAG2532881.1 hypothetical protein JM18_000881 [Phytophthora kernoviae]RLN43787.1 hypothetical protein BBI17_001462 [Phytophthora kernoviae]RLN85369.1 hypothetical protein BBO99_00000645 [Phytophthora kernoviae]